ncbi:MAG: lytic murein transglycosylase [Pseudomonadota bacterium]
MNGAETGTSCRGLWPRSAAFFFACAIAAVAASAAYAQQEANQSVGSRQDPQAQTVGQPSPATEQAGARANLERAFKVYLTGLAARAQAQGVPAPVVTAGLSDIELDDSVLKRLNNQPEFSRPVGDYIAQAVSDTRLATAKTLLSRHAALLGQLESRFGVDRHVLVAIWGLESNFGGNLGRRNVVSALATLGFAGERRARFGETQAIAALRIAAEENRPLADMIGSWAGAMGQTQFIPTTYLAYAVDGDGDGTRDVWGSLADALASAANYLSRSGWRTGAVWGFEVTVPDAFDYADTGRSTRRTWAEWQAGGVTAARKPAPLGQVDPGAGSIILPAGAKGPAFFVARNFRVILRYNQATSYALAIGHLADRAQGGQAFVQPWPADDQPLTRSQRLELQQLLTDTGLDTGGVDGILGPMSRRAIRAMQARLQMTPDGYPTPGLLAKLRETSAGATAATSTE